MGLKILITSPVHQKENIFKEYLESLNHLKIPKDSKIHKLFWLHNCPELKQYLNENEYIEVLNDITLEKEKEQQKQWKIENYKIVAEMRSAALKYARENNYDYIFSVDSDVLLHPYTLLLLLYDNKDIVGHLSWTKLNNNSKLSVNCGQYEGWGTYQNEEIFKKGCLYKIGWTGRTTLISSRVFNNPNIDYHQILGVDNTGSEDYIFCLKAYCNIPDLQIGFETRLPSRHLYQEKDYFRWIEEKKQLGLYEK